MKRTTKIVASALLGTALVAGLGAGATTALAKTQNPGDSTSWTVPTQKMTNTVVKNGKTYKVINTWASMWASNGPDYLGISNSCSLINSDNIGTTSADLDKAKSSTMLGIWASTANESPNAFNWNQFYNLYQDATGGTDMSDQSVATTSWDSTSGTMGAFKYRPEIIWINSRLSMDSSSGAIGASKQAQLIREGKFYSSYTSDDDNTAASGDYSCYNDANYNPTGVAGVFMNSFTFADSFYDLASAAEKVIEDTKDYAGTASDTGVKEQNKLPRATRYEESATECALNFEKVSRGSLYYVLSKINDGTVKKKKVAFLIKDPDTSQSTATVIVHDYVGETAGRAAAGSDGGYPNIAPIVVDQLTTNTKVAEGGEQIEGNSTGGNSIKTDLPWTTYTATADELASCDYVWDVNGSMNKKQLKEWLQSKVTTSEAKQRIEQGKVDYVGAAPSGIYIGAYTAEKALIGAYNVNYFYPELFPNMELIAYWYDEVYHLNTDAIASSMSWGFGNADLPDGTDLSNIGSTYSLKDMEAKFAAGYKYYNANKTKDATISRILSGKSLDGTKTYKFEGFEPSSTYANWANSYKDSTTKKANTVKVAKTKITVKKGKSVKVAVSKAKGSVSVTSSKKTIAAVKYKNGKVIITGKKKGTAKITVKAKGNSSYKAATKTIKVTVK